MSDTYSQINIHCVFAVKRRENFIGEKFRDRLFQYINGILTTEKIFPLAIGGWTDHVHVFFELSPSRCIADIMRIVKAVSSKWINENHFCQGQFRWQEGYGAFSYARSDRDRVIKYIMNQERHHAKKSFRSEYMEILAKFEIDYKDEYLFEFYD